MENGINPSLHNNCHHHIVYAKLRLRIEYLPLYERLIWDYKNDNKELINRAIEGFNREKSLENKNVHSQQTIFSICHNFIPNKIITCNDKDPHWFNKGIRYLLNKKKEMLRQYIDNGKLHFDYERLQSISTTLVDCLKSSKEICHIQLSTKLSNPTTSAKIYWHIMKTFFNGKKCPSYHLY